MASKASKSKSTGENYAALLASIIVCNLAGAVGAIFTFSAISNWWGG